MVAGGAGFVGSHLVDVLMQQGHQVTVLDNFFTGSKRNIEHWLGHHNFELIHHDIVNPFFIEGESGADVAPELCSRPAFHVHVEHLDIRVARVFNTYGPRMHPNDGRVVSNFILQALQNEPITIYGSGKQTRSFQYVSDLVDGLVSLMNSSYTQPVNLGNPHEHTIEDFAKIIKTLVGGTSKIVYTDKVEDDPQRRKPDITRAKTELKWEPKVELQDGLKKTVEYFREELNKNSKSFRNPPSVGQA
ncbi:hypothetical protein HPB47_016137 [Ixodes persulcatus]|uniref:Uncharacterized protein n=1 Tax=Ixodes persulcatus TaxID=34615 RepID=A0AC60QVC5_IXOPE|nr:hypothetical protein HPB47_016137 [Ixodes persulcatus]